MIALALLENSSAWADEYITSIVQPATVTGWNNPIWTNVITPGAGVLPVAGNNYTVDSNGIGIFNLSANARVRNPSGAGLQSFPGDLLTLKTNAELRCKGGTAPLVNFPGVGSNPGLVLNGGVINLADNGVFTITGRVQVASVAYLDSVSDHSATLQPTRALNLRAQLSGAGTFIIFNSATNLPHTLFNTTNTFTGQWLVTSGWLKGTGTNSFGTNNITIDPLAPIGLDPSLVVIAGPAVLEPAYEMNSAGRLTLTNGGRMHLHQNCVFSSVIIEGTPLSSGTHFYAELAANFPNTFLPGGGGSITIQPYGTPPSLAPAVIPQPSPVAVYQGVTAHFTAGATGPGPITNIWRRNGVNLVNGGNISGATTFALDIANASPADAGNYDVVVGNPSGTSTSVVATLTVYVPAGYAAAVVTNAPVAFWELNEAPPTAFDFYGGFNGTYGSVVQTGAAGPQATDGFPGFASTNASVLCLHGLTGGYNTMPALNLNTNTVTITAWINPGDPFQVALNGIAFCRGAGTVSGLRYGSGADVNGYRTLGYRWNDEEGAGSWNSMLVPPAGQWSFVALVITPTNATIYLINTNGMSSASQNYTHVVQSFGANLIVGGDSIDPAGGRTFNGYIDAVAVFNRSLSRAAILDLYSAASGVVAFPPFISTQPIGQSAYTGQYIDLTVGADGTLPVTYQWQAGTNDVYVNLVNGGQFSGATSSHLVISNLTLNNAADYRVVVTNNFGSVTSSIATLTVQSAGPPLNITLTGQQPAGQHWDTAGWWSDGQPASVSKWSNPGSTYEILPGGRLRSPPTFTSIAFPGPSLQIDGSGVYENGNVASGPMGELRLKPISPVGFLQIPHLIMNGGQILQAGDAAGLVVLTGRMDILTNTPLYGDLVSDRGFRIESWLTGAGDIEYRGYIGDFNPANINCLNIANATNSFSGKWNVIVGTLLGSAANSLGTNQITVGTNGAVEVSYDLHNTNATLALSGRMYLHQNHTFASVSVNGNTLAPGFYTFAQLNAAYPTNFPASWVQQNGSAYATASGSINVGNVPPPVPLSIARSGANLQLTWSQGILLEAPDVTGPWTTNNATSPYLVSPTATKKFFRLQLQ